MSGSKTAAGSHLKNTTCSASQPNSFGSLWLSARRGLAFFSGIIALSAFLLLIPLAPMKFSEVQGATTTYTWVQTAASTSYAWNTSANWTSNGSFPNAATSYASFGANITGNQTIYLNQAILVKGITLADAAAITITNGGTATNNLTLSNGSTTNLITVTGTTGQGLQTIAANMTFSSSPPTAVGFVDNGTVGLTVTGLVTYQHHHDRPLRDAPPELVQSPR